MSMGGGSPPVPTPEPIPQVPIRDDPNKLEVARAVVNKSKKQDGHAGHLLSGGPQGDTSSSGSKPKSLIG